MVNTRNKIGKAFLLEAILFGEYFRAEKEKCGEIG
jgi:hypothetical protein